MKISSILLWVQENTLSEKFYKKIGFEVIRSDDRHTALSLGGFEVVLVSMRDEEPFTHDSMAGEKGKGVYLYISVEDVDATYQQLLDKNIEPATKPRDWEWGNREFILKDPDGYKLCFWQPTR